MRLTLDDLWTILARMPVAVYCGDPWMQETRATTCVRSKIHTELARRRPWGKCLCGRKTLYVEKGWLRTRGPGTPAYRIEVVTPKVVENIKGGRPYIIHSTAYCNRYNVDREGTVTRIATRARRT